MLIKLITVAAVYSGYRSHGTTTTRRRDFLFTFSSQSPY